MVANQKATLDLATRSVMAAPHKKKASVPHIAPAVSSVTSSRYGVQAITGSRVTGIRATPMQVSTCRAEHVLCYWWAEWLGGMQRRESEGRRGDGNGMGSV